LERNTFIRIRKRLGFTQGQLARKLGVHRVTVTNWERGAAGIPGPVLRLVRRLDTDRKAKNRTRWRPRWPIACWNLGP